MTAFVDDDVDSVESAPPALHRSRRRLLAGLGVAVAAGAIVAGGYLWAAHSAVAAVHAGYDAEPVECDTAEVASVDVLHDGYLHPTVPLQDGMTCTLRIHVSNDGWADARIDAVTVNGFGTDNPLGLRAESVSPNGGTAVGSDDAAAFALSPEVSIAPGETTLIEVVLSYAGGASMVECSSQGWDIPVVTVSALGATTAVQPGEQIFFFQGDPATCAE
ncbi:hypothetical protein [Microbacterium sp. NPDC057650]|uniref:hypothetical protein n=1 Tax=unclassified Microbacterium TaxID=2609290 RepID=UPI00366FF1D8